MIIKCKVCGGEFTRKLSEIKKGFNKFCTAKCMGIAKRKKVNIACKVCGTIFKVKPIEIKKGGGKFCSRRCYIKSRSGSNSNLWDGGKTAPHILIRNSTQYCNWRDSVFKRDNFTCQKCGKYGGDMHAHHIKKFSIILNDIKQEYPLLLISDIATNHADLWDIKNGITLCKKCHKKEHSRR